MSKDQNASGRGQLTGGWLDEAAIINKDLFHTFSTDKITQKLMREIARQKEDFIRQIIDRAKMAGLKYVHIPSFTHFSTITQDGGAHVVSVSVSPTPPWREVDIAELEQKLKEKEEQHAQS